MRPHAAVLVLIPAFLNFSPMPGLAQCLFAEVDGCDSATYLLPDSRVHRLSQEQQDLISETDGGDDSPNASALRLNRLRLMRNEIYARHGYIFQDEKLQAYFDRKNWYHRVSRDVKLNDIEQYNVNALKRIEAIK